MTWEQYWYGDVWMVEGFREADKLNRRRTNAAAHMMGMYIYEAFCDVAPVLHAFAKKGTKPIATKISCSVNLDKAFFNAS